MLVLPNWNSFPILIFKVLESLITTVLELFAYMSPINLKFRFNNNSFLVLYSRLSVKMSLGIPGILFPEKLLPLSTNSLNIYFPVE